MAEPLANPGGLAGTGVSDPGAPIHFQLIDAAPVAFHGLAESADPGQSGAGMPYPVVGIVGLLTAIATHAVLVKTSESHERSKQENAAEAVLDPFRAGLTDVSLRTLLNSPATSGPVQRAFEILPDAEVTSPAWRLELSPTFLMSKDQRVLILEAQVKAQRQPDREGSSPYANVIRVISAPREDIATDTTATPEQVRHLIDDSSALLVQALEMLSRSLRDAEHPAQGARLEERTVRYKEGVKQRFERGVVLAESCDRVELRTLRGWLMSVPRQSPPTQADCTPH
ncbi:hypothetical protein [Ideonella sp. B508-1]|uniref:hypothetical protein n=1 Tax=Ideonella sp. B508-1 TaxID=137716 RepID=UPI00034D4E47|nr:hypothetical protein [Ideonella sp. B508-1]